jgi:hexosaminidase
VNTCFGSPLHRFDGDEVACMWETAYNNKLFETFLKWLKDLSSNKSLVLWDDPINDEEKDVNISKEWVIQSWNNGVTQKVLNRNHRAIVSESDAFCIENAEYDKIMSFALPNNPNVA